jgi:hypothetical protein
MRVDNAGSGYGAYVYNTGSSGSYALYVRQHGPTSGLFVDQNGTCSGFEAGIYLENTDNTGKGLFIYSNNSTGLDSLTTFWADNSTFTQTVLNVRQDGTGA